MAKNLYFTDWYDGIFNSLLSYRTAQHSVTKHRPVDLFFNFSVKGLVPNKASNLNDAAINNYCFKEKTKANKDKRCSTNFYLPNSYALLNDINKDKFNLKGDKVKIVKQVDTHSVIVKKLDGRILQVSISRLSPLPNVKKPIDDEDLDFVPDTSLEPNTTGQPQLRQITRSVTTPSSYQLDTAHSGDTSDEEGVTMRSSIRPPNRFIYFEKGKSTDERV